MTQTLVLRIKNLQVKLEAHLAFGLNLRCMRNAKKLSYALIIQPSYEIFRNDAPVMIEVVILIEIHPVDERRVILVRSLDDRCVGLNHSAGQYVLLVDMMVVLCEWNMLALDFPLD